MKAIYVAIVLIALSRSFLASAQGTFQNLNFEDAGLSYQTDVYVPISGALPDWSVYFGTVLQSQALENDYGAGPRVDIIHFYPPSWALPSGAPGVIDGSYTVALQADYQSGVNTSLEQNGLIPIGTQTIEFKAWQSGTSFSVSINGNNLPLANLGSYPNYTLYAANISSFAGHTGLLDFTAYPNGSISYVAFDDITFSTVAIPEPSPLVLTGIGGLLFAIYRRLKSN